MWCVVAGATGDGHKPPSIKVELPGICEGFWITSDIIAHHPAPRKLEVGSQVRGFGIVGTVKAIFEKEAWVHVDGAGCATYRLGELNVHSDLQPSQ